jgi:hypothetical protein
LYKFGAEAAAAAASVVEITEHRVVQAAIAMALMLYNQVIFFVYKLAAADVADVVRNTAFPA